MANFRCNDIPLSSPRHIIPSTLYPHVNKEYNKAPRPGHLVLLGTILQSLTNTTVVVYMKRWLPRNTFGAVQTSH
jgi:hypothetical protein